MSIRFGIPGQILHMSGSGTLETAVIISKVNNTGVLLVTRLTLKHVP